MSWTPGVVDEQGWNESMDLVNETLDGVIEIHAASAKRLAKSGEEGIPATAVMMDFEGLSSRDQVQKKASKRRKSKKEASEEGLALSAKSS